MSPLLTDRNVPLVMGYELLRVGPASRRRAQRAGATPAPPCRAPVGRNQTMTPRMVACRTLPLVGTNRPLALLRPSLRCSRKFSIRQLSAAVKQLQPTVQPLAYRHRSAGQHQLLVNLGQLEPTILESQGPVVLYYPGLLNRKHSIHIQPSRHAPV